ncbi:uncharacterized protein BX663DRAFT_527024 [Cokeromyces recurvatus]|uniref:uncharacterized protein n=1 Tax=Cokeromyces recurvatus TaxID=90255 RepID=UPI0022200F13|nr:uncharacterized protein BX663DRAFT_527024 [Cokeromyces recurvatus]KAI7897838.1 hypothetical protein BX663DRAFT_527024 [Cokeromyces recurvatus]
MGFLIRFSSFILFYCSCFHNTIITLLKPLFVSRTSLLQGSILSLLSIPYQQSSNHFIFIIHYDRCTITHSN